MLGPTHQLGAVAAALAVAAARPEVLQADVPTLAVAAAALSLGASAPDLDQGRGPLGFLLRSACFGHRALTHSIAGLVLAGVGLATVVAALDRGASGASWGAPVVGAFLLGMVSHLVLDSLTPRGIPLFWPVPLDVRLPVLRALTIRTGGWVERLVVAPGLIGVSLLAGLRLWPLVQGFFR